MICFKRVQFFFVRLPYERPNLAALQNYLCRVNPTTQTILENGLVLANEETQEKVNRNEKQEVSTRKLTIE